MSSDSTGTPNSTVLLCTADGVIQQVISACSDLARIAVKGARLADFLDSVHSESFHDEWLRSIPLRNTAEIHVRVRGPEATPKFDKTWRLVASPLQPESSSPEVIVVCFRSESSRDETAIYRALMQTAVDAIISIDSRGIIISVNPAVQRMFGYEPTELLGQNVSTLMPAPEAAEHDRYLADYLRTGVASIIGVGRRVSARCRDGRLLPVHLSVSEFSLDGERFFTGIVRDLSELESVQQQLLQSERLAAIGQMVTGLAHESRNALQRAQAHLDMLALDLQNAPDQLDLARRTTQALQDLHRLYEEVRGYAAPIHLEYRPVELASIWRKEWDHLAAVRSDKDIWLNEDPDNEHVRCEIDVHRMEQVFRNILENAIHACDGEGTVTVRLKTRNGDDGETAIIEFSDNGCGLTALAAERIFEPFFTTKQKGTGLGMAIVYRIITAHGGDISATRDTERGVTTIHLELPVHPSSRKPPR